MAEKIHGYRADVARMAQVPSVAQVKELTDMAISIGSHPELEEGFQLPEREFDYRADYPVGGTDVTVGLAYSPIQPDLPPDITVVLERPQFKLADSTVLRQFAFGFTTANDEAGVMYGPAKVLDKYVQLNRDGSEIDITAYRNMKWWKARHQLEAAAKLERSLGTGLFTILHYNVVHDALDQLDPLAIIEQLKKQKASREVS